MKALRGLEHAIHEGVADPDAAEITKAERAEGAVKLTRKPNGEMVDFKGQVGVGSTTYDITSNENSDLSEKEFQDNQTTDDGIAAAPKDFTEVSPEAVGVRVSLEAASDFLKTLRGQNVEVSLSSLEIGCDSLRAGSLVINLATDPERAAALVAKANVPWQAVALNAPAPAIAGFSLPQVANNKVAALPPPPQQKFRVILCVVLTVALRSIPLTFD